MGAGLGIGEGKGKGVKGGWRVSAFLLFLTGWQAVLLPWSPLILKDAGFSATSVGVLSGTTTIAASVGVVVCLRGVRRNRSGAVRRLLLWLLLAAAAFLQGCGVGLELRHLSLGGAMPSCVSVLFVPATSVFLLNNMTIPPRSLVPTTVSSQHSHSPSTLATTSEPSPTSPHPFNGSHGAVTSVNLQNGISHQPTPAITPPATISTSTTIIPTSILLAPVNPANITKTTTVSAITFPITTSPATTTSIRPTVPAAKTPTKQSNDKVLFINKTRTVGTLTFGKDNITEAPHRPPVGQGKYHAAHIPLIPVRNGDPLKHHYNSVHPPAVSPENSERSKNFGQIEYHMKHNNIKGPDDNDHFTSQDDPKDDDDMYPQDVDEYDSPEESEERGDKLDYEDDTRNLLHYYPKSGIRFRSSSGKLPESSENELPGVPKTANFPGIPSNPLQHNIPSRINTALRKPYLQESQEEKSPQHTALFSAKKRKQSKGYAPLLYHQEDLPLIPDSRHHPHNPKPMTKTYRPHHPSHSPKDSSDSKSQYGGYDLHQIDSRHAILRRNRRDLTKAEKNHVLSVKDAIQEAKPQHDEKLENKQNSLKNMRRQAVKVGVAVLLALGGLTGAGVEAAVAQLWHCFVHGYDESGVSQDVLQRTITHTFHLSAYGNHKTWTGITSGGWAMGAGVVSILTCLAGIGGGGYGGLLGVHLVLGMGALLLLLILPVPYGSIDPPRTRRPLSLYLDDEVLREGVRRLTFHIWVFINGCLAALSLTFSLWLLQEMTAEGWVVGSQAGAVGMTLMCESLGLHTQRRLVTHWGLHGLMGVCGVTLMLHYGIMWASESVGMVVVAHAGLGVAMAFLWVAVKHNALLLATVSDQEREAWASWWCWRIGVGVGAAVWGVGMSGTGDRVRPLLLPATIVTAILAAALCVTAVLSRRNSKTRRRVYHTLDLDIANDEVDEEENDASEDDWLVKRARKEGLSL